MVCRVFQKSSAAKKPQQTSQPSMGSPCDTNSMVNEFGDVKPPNLNTIANSSNGFTNISAHTYNNNNVNTNMNLAMNWPAPSSEVPSLPSFSWPSSGLLNPNLSVNSLILKALQLRTNYQQREAAASTDHFAMSSFIPQPQGVSHVGSSTDLQSSNPNASSSSKVLDCMPQQQQEQPFNLDSMW